MRKKENSISNSMRDWRIFTVEFKNQIVQLYLNGKSKVDIRKEYNLFPSTLDKWIKQHPDSGSFRTKDNLKDEQK